MLKKAIFVFVCSGLFVRCDPPRTSRNFASLSEDEKRLPQNALSSMEVADGLEVELFAAEPMLTNPTNISVDARGRVWVCEAYNYDVAPDKADPKGDRVVVLEDTDHDGKADKRTVFYQGTDLILPLGVMVLADKIYVTCSPNVFVFTDADGDLVPEKKEIVFSKMSKGEHSTHSLLPGPDGMFYFSIGNYTRNIADKDGVPLVDKAGFTVAQSGEPYLGGMVLRFTPEGKQIEVLGHNFRNNYEPCVDSYGNVWQSDNDDDGNESCRINFVMSYGNYGFLDEMSKASWTTNRINVEETIQQRHWHQNDPGVVPNVLITGAGSPAGMTFYEGSELPPVFQNTPIHAEPYYNVVRAYVPGRKGAGYTLEVEEILKSHDKWFRPVDVAVAPDGSLFVADWYDPILGGGAAGDADQGRIFRIARDVSKYAIAPSDESNIPNLIEALKNSNGETHHVAFYQLLKEGKNAVPAIQALWKSNNQVYRARALWLLARMDTSETFLKEALNDKNVDIRIAAIRAVAQLKSDVGPYLKSLVKDESFAVRREIALALRYSSSPEAASLWVDLARQYDGKDRWYLEALGIGADLHSDLFFETWKSAVNIDLNDKVHQDIIWRSRSKHALHLLAELIKVTDDPKSYTRYFRAFDFHKDPAKNAVLASLLQFSRKDSKEISSLALQQMDGKQILMTATLRSALERSLNETRGTIAFVNLVEKFSLKEKQKDLLTLASTLGDKDPGPAAASLLLRFGGTNLIETALQSSDSSSIMLLQSFKGIGNGDVIRLIGNVVHDSTKAFALRKTAVQILGSSWPGEEKLLSLVKEPGFEKSLKPAAAGILFNVYRSRIQREAGHYLPKPGGRETELPTIKQLLASTGNAKQGESIFKTYCIACHRVKGYGTKFGPELSLIDDKLSKEGLYRAILYPDEGVSYGYESTMVKLKDGTESMGIVVSETSNEIILNVPGGTPLKYEKANVEHFAKDDKSLMPSLAGSMSEQALVDLVEYLSLLEK